MKRFFLIGAVLIALQLMAHQTADAQTFSVERVSVDVVGGFPPPDDILSPSLAVGSPPGLVLPGISASGVLVEVDGFSYGRQFDFDPQTSTIEFSVDAFATGVGGSGVFIESSLGGSGEQNYDVYRTDLATAPGTNVQIHDGNGLGPAGTVAPLGMAEPQSALPNIVHPGVDGYDSRGLPGRDIYWSWESRFNPPPPVGGSFSGADVLISSAVAGYDGAGAIFASSAMLGLISSPVGVSDDIDALEVFDYGPAFGGTLGVFDPGLDLILFSLDPSSPSLGLGVSPADVLFSSGGGGFGLAIPSVALGLTPNDNLTALSVVPEPNAAVICWFALGLAAAKRRRRV
jgi:hypothetical protein